MSEVRWLDEREERSWRALQLMQLQLNAALARQLAADSRLSYQDYGVLVALTARPEGRIRLFELGAALGWEKSRLSHHIARMVERGLVTKVSCGTDRRGAFVAVAPCGREELAAAAPGHVEAVRRLFLDQVTPEQLDAIGSAAEAVLGALGEHAGPVPASDPCDG